MDGKWGYINQKGDMAIELSFDTFKSIDDTDVMESFNKGVAAVRINDEIRFSDVKGNYVSAKNYEPRHLKKNA